MEEDRKRVEAHKLKEEAVCAHPRTEETNVAEDEEKDGSVRRNKRGIFVTVEWEGPDFSLLPRAHTHLDHLYARVL